MSRSAESCIFGKCTEEIRFRVPEETVEILIKKSREAGFSTLSEYLRMVVLIKAYGKDEIKRIQNQRTDLIA